jgi:SAM-dependent methyltransferase
MAPPDGRPDLDAIARAHGASSAVLPAGAPAGPGPRALELSGAPAPPAELADLAAGLGESDLVLLWVRDRGDDATLAAWRDAVWPLLHLGAVWSAGPSGLRRTTLQGSEAQEGASGWGGAVLVGSRRSHVLAPDSTAQKFDANAKGWDGEPGTPGYGHFRWMRRLVAQQAGSPEGGARSFQRILDFGSGAGWVGIEAALQNPGASLSAFDPSPAMVEIASANAKGSGLVDFTGRVGFGEDPPFPAEGEAPYDLVLSSGVISFSPDHEAWLDGLARTVAPGGTLVVGDIHGGSRGFQRRRRSKPLLPVRELSACTRGQVREGLEARGFRFDRWFGYQLSRPVPELMHLDATRLGGVLARPLLGLNRVAAGADRLLGSPAQNLFDSWVMRLHRPA